MNDKLRRAQHTKIFTGSSQGPEKISIFIFAYGNERAISKHERGTFQVVGNQSKTGVEFAVSAPQSQSGKANLGVTPCNQRIIIKKRIDSIFNYRPAVSNQGGSVRTDGHLSHLTKIECYTRPRNRSSVPVMTAPEY